MNEISTHPRVHAGHKELPVSSFSLMRPHLCPSITAWKPQFWRSKNYDKYTRCTVHRVAFWRRALYLKTTANPDISGERNKSTEALYFFGRATTSGGSRYEPGVTRTRGDDDNATRRYLELYLDNQQTQSFPTLYEIRWQRAYKELSNSERDEINGLLYLSRSLSLSIGFAIRHLLQKFANWFTAVRLARYLGGYAFLFFSARDKTSGETGRMFTVYDWYISHKIMHSPSTGSLPHRSSPHVSRTQRSGSKNGERFD